MIVDNIIKIYRYFRIYGFSRTYIKVFGRNRRNPLIKFPLNFFSDSKKQFAIIGAGQFAFSTLGYFLKKNYGNCIVGVYDINNKNAVTFAKYHSTKVFLSANDLMSSDDVKVVYIASNHSTHTDYAISALLAGKIVYVEKPISVTKSQFLNLMLATKNRKLFVGYNRPFSPAIILVRKVLDVETRRPLTLNCFITGHKLEKDHWYRDLNEGTRVCGNIGHWLDLSINLLNKIGMPTTIDVSIVCSNLEEKDDNLSISMVTNEGDLIGIMLSSREDPFEGINESINIQHSKVIVKIDDFRRMTIWDGVSKTKRRYFRKDVGHENAILQPFSNLYERDFGEIEVSTRLMLEITESLINGDTHFVFVV